MASPESPSAGWPEAFAAFGPAFAEAVEKMDEKLKDVIDSVPKADETLRATPDSARPWDVDGG